MWDLDCIFISKSNCSFWTGLHTEMVLALCYLCRESVNRAKIRRAGGLPLMLRIIRNCSTATLRSSILNALVQFLYDETSLQVRITCVILLFCCCARDVIMADVIMLLIICVCFV
jgi:hypothetical protein